ncbi:MAG: hypothetical protein M1524_03470 [Patescibacteria group bacterium]|nr:hypothetical protein [Patescibacteria group bacterium]
MKIVARIVSVFFLSFIFYILSFITPSYAQSQTYQTNQFITPNTNPDVPKNLSTWTQSLMIEVVSAMNCQLAGVDPISPTRKCLGIVPSTGKIGFVQNDSGGVIGLVGNMITTLYTPQLHTGDYVSYLASNFGVVKSAYAQKTGYAGLEPLMKIWTKFRDIVYLIFILIFIVIGLMIMLRVKIDPRTVMSIQNQLPKIIIALILVTFSYAIAGFLIDIMWVLLYLMISLFASIDPSIVPATVTAKLYDNPIGFIESVFIEHGGGIFGIAYTTAGGFQEVVRSVVKSTVDNSDVGWVITKLSYLPNLHLVIKCAIESIGPGSFDTCYKEDLATQTAAIAWAFGYLIILIAILWALLRVWFKLLIAYVAILLDVVLAPLWIVAGVVPAVGGRGFGSWLRHFLSYLLAFPTVLALLLIGKVIMNGFNEASKTQYVFTPPFLGFSGEPDALGALIGFGIILMVPRAVNYMQAALKPPKIDLTPITSALGAGAGVVGSGTSKTFGRLTQPENKQTGAPEGVLRRLALGQKGGWRRRWTGSAGSSKT